MQSFDLTIHRSVPPGKLAAEVGAPPKGTGDINLSNILKLIPADIVAIYIAGKGLVVAPIGGWGWPVVLFWLCMIACIIVRFLAAKATSDGVNIMLIVVTAVAFFVWAHAVIDTAGPVIAGFKGSAAGIVAMLIGVIGPKLVPAQLQA